MGEKKTAKCWNCDQETTYYTRERKVTEKTSHGVDYSYNLVEPICDECGKVTWVSDITDENINARWNALLEAYKQNT